MRLLKDPLFHFLLFGAAIFAWYALQTPSPRTESTGDEIVVDDRDVLLLVERFRAAWRRPPQPPELASLVEDLVREEVLVREAEKLGLDRDDAVIRSRLRQKMEFLTESLAQSMQPGEEELRAHLKANSERFVTDPAIAFEQVFLGQSPPPALIDDTRAALEAGADPAGLGERTLLPPGVDLSPPQIVAATFGGGFFDAVAALPTGRWAGPVQSGYGAHLARLTESRPAALPPLVEIRNDVLFDWRRDKAVELSEAQIAGLAERYTITRPSDAALAELLQP